MCVFIYLLIYFSIIFFLYYLFAQSLIIQIHNSERDYSKHVSTFFSKQVFLLTDCVHHFIECILFYFNFQLKRKDSLIPPQENPWSFENYIESRFVLLTNIKDNL